MLRPVTRPFDFLIELAAINPKMIASSGTTKVMNNTMLSRPSTSAATARPLRDPVAFGPRSARQSRNRFKHVEALGVAQRDCRSIRG